MNRAGSPYPRATLRVQAPHRAQDTTTELKACSFFIPTPLRALGVGKHVIVSTGGTLSSAALGQYIRITWELVRSTGSQALPRMHRVRSPEPGPSRCRFWCMKGVFVQPASHISTCHGSALEAPRDGSASSSAELISWSWAQQ